MGWGGWLWKLLREVRESFFSLRALLIHRIGFASQANEFSTYMLLGSHFVLNQCAATTDSSLRNLLIHHRTTHAESHAIHPYLHSFSNHFTTGHLLRRVLIPDICPAEVLGAGQGGAFSLVAGDFEEVYGPEHWDDDDPSSEFNQEDGGGGAQRGKWGAVVTCFFMDCVSIMSFLGGDSVADDQARNVLNFLRIIHTLLEDDGIWINIGVLLYTYSL